MSNIVVDFSIIYKSKIGHTSSTATSAFVVLGLLAQPPVPRCCCCSPLRELSKALNVASSSSSSSDAINIASNQEGTAISSTSAYDCSKLLEALHGIQEVFKYKEEHCRENIQICEGRTRVTGKNRKARIERRLQRQRLLFEKCQSLSSFIILTFLSHFSFMGPDELLLVTPLMVVEGFQ
ncbi:hypothetical protein RGQ29_018208 [Quercus rubra]|uniref:Uncharacterized protein n=1 Tax=Quercus rubra TaxID=3512 RepID=A0AAN7J1M4_QUERU|nr:hypothetical protein RGQ29_018208 [Quercus rubra]